MAGSSFDPSLNLGFDPNGAVKFDLRSGAAADARGGRLMLLPRAALEALEGTHPAALAIVGAETGRACGARVASRLGGADGVRAADLETVVSHLAGELAVAGIGVVHLERWGRAMVVVVTNPIAGDRFVAEVIGGALGAAAGRDVVATPLGREGTAVRFFVGKRSTGEVVARAVDAGRPYGEVLSELHGRTS